MNQICELLKIRYPIFQGGMGNISNAQLTAAVSEAGGLGTIGTGTMSPDEVEKIILETKKATNNPFAVNIALSVTPNIEELIALTIKHHIPIVTLSAGNPEPFIPIFQKENIKVITIVASVKHAKKAEAAGADILVAEGFEAAGINSNLEITTFTLVPQIAKNVNIPVVAAGGIGDGRGLAAALMLGASGVQLGTRFIATKEAPFHKDYKQTIVNAEGSDTLVIGRSIGRTRRVLITPYSRKLSKMEQSGMTLEQYNKLTSEEHHVKGAYNGDMDDGFLNGGQVSGLVDHIPSVKELINDMMNEASSQIHHAAEDFRLKYMFTHGK